MFNKCIKIAALLALTISLSGCFLFGGGDNAEQEWLVNPTAIISPEMAITFVAELFELPEDMFYAEDGTISAVTAEGGRREGFAVFLREPLWNEDVSFFLVTRDYRLFLNFGGEEVRSGVFLIVPIAEDMLTEIEPEPTPDVGDDDPIVPPNDEPEPDENGWTESSTPTDPELPPDPATPTSIPDEPEPEVLQ
jgi:hypothetical protein